MQIVRNACGVAVINDYHELHRCNIRSICEPPPKTGTLPAEKAAAAAPEAVADEKPVEAAGTSETNKPDVAVEVVVEAVAEAVAEAETTAEASVAVVAP